MENKIVYKRSFFSLLKGIIGAPFAGVLAGIIAGFFFPDNTTLLLGIGLVVMALILLTTIFSENIRLEIDDNELRYYKRGKLRETYTLNQITVGYRTRVESGVMGNEDLTLRIFVASDEREASIDCSPLGVRRFYKLFAYLEEHTIQAETEVLRAE